MNDEQMKKMLEDAYDESREETLRSMARDFYNRKMVSVVILVWIWAIFFIAAAAYAAIEFFRTDNTQYQIMYAAVFICCAEGLGLMKILAWQMMHRNSIKREIKRLELRISELSDIMKHK
jgi:uncharacterized membrane protein YbjE (DUF340 family)